MMFIFTSVMRPLLREAQGAAAHNGLLRSRDCHGDHLLDFLELATSSRRTEVLGDMVGFRPGLRLSGSAALLAESVEFLGKRHLKPPVVPSDDFILRKLTESVCDLNHRDRQDLKLPNGLSELLHVEYPDFLALEGDDALLLQLRKLPRKRFARHAESRS